MTNPTNPPIPTVAVLCEAATQDGGSVQGFRIVARLTALETYEGLVVPEETEGTFDANGQCVLQLWPNALGVAGSAYRVQAFDAAGRRWMNTTAVVPNSDCRLEQIIVAEPYPAIDAAQQALIAAQGALAPVTAQAAAAAASALVAQDAEDGALAAETAAQASAAAAQASEQAAATSEASASSSATTATSAASTATEAATAAEAARDAAQNSASTATTQATAASQSAQAADASADAAAASQAAAAGSASTAQTQATAAAGSASTAQTSQQVAASSQVAAEAARDEAQEAQQDIRTNWQDKLDAANAAATSAQAAATTATTQAATATTQAAEAQAAADAAEAARDAAQLSAGVYADIAAGLAATTNDKYFNVPATGDEDALVLYRNNSGVAAEVTRYPSKLFFDRRIPNLPIRSSGRVPLFMDDQFNVPVWLEEGDLAAKGIASSLVTLMLASLDHVVVSQGIEISDTPSASRIPLFVDENGNVPVWLENGNLAARGISESLIADIANAISYAPQTPAKLPVATDGRSIFLWRSRIATLQQAATGIPKVLITGDSWTEYVAIPQQLANVLRAEFGQSGYGWISTNGTYMLDGVTFGKSGWTMYDASTGALPTNGCGIDGQAIEATGTAATLSIGNCKAQTIKIFYRKGNGAFRYRVDGGSWTSVSGDNTGSVGTVTVSGLTDVEHTLDIDLSGNAGTVRLYGFHASRTAPGIELIKAGNSGLDASQAANISANIGAFAAAMAPDVVIICLGTNDYRRDIPIATYTAGLTALANAYRAALPNVGLIFIAPADSNGVAVRPLTEYRDAVYHFCITNGYEFYNHHAEFATFSASNSLGMWVDNLHLNDKGARFVANSISRHFLKF